MLLKVLIKSENAAETGQNYYKRDEYKNITVCRECVKFAQTGTLSGGRLHPMPERIEAVKKIVGGRLYPLFVFQYPGETRFFFTQKKWKPLLNQSSQQKQKP